MTMIDPTQPESTNQGQVPPETDGDEWPAAVAESEQPDPAAAPKAKAYVDPSIAAEAQQMALEAEAADWKDRYLRAQAEMVNLRKRTEREKTDTSKYAISRFAVDMLAVADNLQRALAAFAATGAEPDPQTKSLIEGVELTERELGKALERHGVTQVESLGAIFDPNEHQAVMEEDNKDVAAGTVVRVFQEGYRIGDRVLRPSMVVVARGGVKPVKQPASEAATDTAGNDDLPPGEDATGDTPGGDPDRCHTTSAAGSGQAD